MKPGGHSQSHEPGALMQTEPEGHEWVPRAHSSTSTQSPPCASYPEGHAQLVGLEVLAHTLPHCASEGPQRQTPLEQTASPRQSEFAKQPEVQCRVSGLHPKSPGQGVVVQSEGSTWQLPRLQTRPAMHSRPQAPQLFSSVERSRHVVPHRVVVPAQVEPGVVETLVPASGWPASGRGWGWG